MLCGILLAGCGGNAPQASQPQTNTVPVEMEAGKRLFDMNCAVCHSHGHPMPLPELVRSSPHFASDASLTRFLRHPSGGMPTFTAERLSDDDVAVLYAYLRNTYAGVPEQALD